jgi:hypothetical protein
VTVARCLLCRLSVIGDDAAVVDARFRAHDCATQIVGSGAPTGDGGGAASRVQPGPTPFVWMGLRDAQPLRWQWHLNAGWWES